MNDSKLVRSSFNPYRHLITKVTGLLRTEAKMTADERRANQWQLLVKFSDTQVIVGKGDVNTIFFQMGTQERKACYPDQILERLNALADQKHWRYEVVDAAGKSRFFFSLELLKKKVEPQKGMKIYGHRNERTLVHTAKQGLKAFTWK